MNIIIFNGTFVQWHNIKRDKYVHNYYIFLIEKVGDIIKKEDFITFIKNIITLLKNKGNIEIKNINIYHLF